MKKIVFFGTEKFAANILEALVESAQFEIVLVVTQPDRPVGRKQELQKPPVKIVAEKYNLPTEQPESLKEYNLPADVDLNIVCEYGLIIPKRIVDTPQHGSINIHPSLLPKYRGASPIQSVLINGENETGVSIMLMDEKMDHGAILRQDRVKIDPTDNYTTLAEKLQKTAILALKEALNDYLDGKIVAQPQNDTEATFCSIFTKEDGRTDWQKTAVQNYNLSRGLEIWPGLWTTYQDKRLKLISVLPTDEIIAPGKILLKNKKVFIGCSTGALELITVQPEGKNPMPALAWANGCHDLEKITLL